MLSPLHVSTVVRNLWDLFGFLIRETNGIGGILFFFFFLDGGREVLVWVAFVFFFLKKENYILNGSHLSLFHKKHRDLTFPWCQCGSQKLLIPVCVLHSVVGSLDIIEGPWVFFVVVFGCAMWSRTSVPWPGVEPESSAVRAWSCSHWTPREVPEGPWFWLWK